MENILFIAHHFPPMGGPGSKRPTQFVKNLRDQGYNPIVLTITKEDIKNGPYPLDESRMDGLDKIEIIRTKTREPRKLRGLAEKLRVFRLFWFFLNPIFWEKSALWPFVSYQTAKKIIEKYNIQKVITTSSPFSALILGWLLKKRLDVKWVADIRDPYTDGYMWNWPSKLHWHFSRILEKEVLRSADRIVVNTPEVKKLYLKRRIGSDRDLICITNGLEC